MYGKVKLDIIVEGTQISRAEGFTASPRRRSRKPDRSTIIAGVGFAANRPAALREERQ